MATTKATGTGRRRSGQVVNAWAAITAHIPQVHTLRVEERLANGKALRERAPRLRTPPTRLDSRPPPLSRPGAAAGPGRSRL